MGGRLLEQAVGAQEAFDFELHGPAVVVVAVLEHGDDNASVLPLGEVGLEAAVVAGVVNLLALARRAVKEPSETIVGVGPVLVGAPGTAFHLRVLLVSQFF